MLDFIKLQYNICLYKRYRSNLRFVHDKRDMSFNMRSKRPRVKNEKGYIPISAIISQLGSRSQECKYQDIIDL